MYTYAYPSINTYPPLPPPSPPLSLGGNDSVSSGGTLGLGYGLDASESLHTQISRDPGPGGAMPIVMTR